MKNFCRAALCGFLLLLPACAALEEQPGRLDLARASFTQLPGWQEDNVTSTLDALRRSCAVMKARASAGKKDYGRAGAWQDWKPVCENAAQTIADDPVAAREFFEENFTPWRASNRGDREGLFTGYYEPELRGSLRRHGPYQTPLYAVPDDMITADLGAFREDYKGKKITGRVEGKKFVPYHDRAAITQKPLKNAKILLWVDDPVDAFFLEIQGSGRVTLENGKMLQVGYAGQNGHQYVAIGRELIKRGALEKGKASMQSIRAWLAAHPHARTEILNLNPSYVFFAVRTGEGAKGAQGVTLTPQRSLAVDPAFIAYGTPLWLDIEDPLEKEKRIRRLVVAQDTGGAIKGPVRGDLFWGHGADAALRAGMMQSKGGYYLLLPKTVNPHEQRTQ